MTGERATPMKLTPTRFAIASSLVMIAIFAGFHDDPWRALLEGGDASRLVVLGCVLGAVLVGVGLFRPNRLVSTAAVGLGILMPAAFGIFGHAWCVRIVEAVLVGADPRSFDSLAGRGFLESLRPLGLGAIGSGVLSGLAALSTIRTGDTRPAREAALIVIAVLALSNAYASMDFADGLLDVSATDVPVATSADRESSATHFAGIRLALGGLVVVAFVAIVARAMKNTRSEPRGDLLLLGVLVTLIVGDVGITTWSSHTLARFVRTSFRARLDSFHALRLDARPWVGRDLVVVPGAAFVDATRIPLEAAALERAFRDLDPSATPIGAVVAVAFDARVEGRTIRLVFESARRAGAQTIELHGLAPIHPDEADGLWSNARLDHSFARALLPMLSATTIALGRSNSDVVVGSSPSLRIAVADRPVILPVAESANGGAGGLGLRAARWVQIAIDDRATPRALVETIARVREGGDAPYVVETYGPDPTPRDANGIGILGGSR